MSKIIDDTDLLKILSSINFSPFSHDEEDSDCFSLREIEQVIRDADVKLGRSTLQRLLARCCDNGTLSPTMGRKRDRWGRITLVPCYEIPSNKKLVDIVNDQE